MIRLLPALAVLLVCVTASAADTGTLRVQVRDSRTRELLPCRVYLQSADGEWRFVKSANPLGSAVEYRVQRSPDSVEMHTTVSAHPFGAELPAGTYRLTVERGKEYLPDERTVEVAAGKTLEVDVPLRRWIDMAARGWYSGDTHVHRTVDELPNAMLAEDLNVAFPLSYWVTTSHTPPTQGNKNAQAAPAAELIRVDDTHVIYPLNTEYEIFSVGPQRHTLGAVFVLNHKRPIDLGVPLVAPVAAEARRQDALLDLDKHAWPWSLMIVPVMKVDLFELSNNHVWRTGFLFRQWDLERRPDWLPVADPQAGWTESEWIEFIFRTYYTLLDCGFRMRPTGGTASGVHPVPLGFGRVYVHLPDGFEYNAWAAGLDAGNSFVTTGPMLTVAFNGRRGATFNFAADETPTCRVTGRAESGVPLERIEVVVNGEVARRIEPENKPTAAGGYASPIDERLELDGSSWAIVRCYENRPDKRVRFAHTSPAYFDVEGRPLRPRKREIGYLVKRMQEELARNRDVLQPAELDEYRRALEIYERIAETAR